MTTQQNHLDQANGTTVTTANSASSGDAFGQLSTTSLTLTYSTDQHMHGTSSLKVGTPGSGSSSGYVAYKYPTGSLPRSVAFRFYIYLTALPSAAMNVCYLYSTSEQVNAVNINQTGQLGYSTSGASTLGQTIAAGTFTFSTAAWYRIEGTAVADPSNGSLRVQVFSGDSTTPLVTLNPTGIVTSDSTNAGFSQVQFGKNTSAPTVGAYYLDDVGVADSATTLGPYTANAPTVSAASSVAGTTASLTTTVSTYDAVAPTYAWTQTAGPTLAVSSAATANPTVSPLAIAGTYTYHVVITDDLGQTASADVTFSYAGAAAGPAVSGTLMSIPRWVEQITATATAGGALSYAISPSTGTTLLAPGIFTGPLPSVATPYTVTVTEAGNSNTTSYRFTVPGSVTASGGLRILLANADQTAGGSFS